MKLAIMCVFFAGGIFNIIRGIRCQKKKRQGAGILRMIMASCMFIFALGILASILLSSDRWAHAILGIQGIDIGVCLGIFIAMRITENCDQDKDKTKMD